MKVSGNIYFNGKLRHGTMDFSGTPHFENGIADDGLYGTLIPMPVNAHTHVGDSFINDEPSGTLPDIVGPGGLKHRMLEHARASSIIDGITHASKFMWESGTLSYLDFREGGLKGVNNSNATGDGTGYGLTVKKNYESYAQKLKDLAKENITSMLANILLDFPTSCLINNTLTLCSSDRVCGCPEGIC